MFNRDKETTTREKNLIKSNLSKVKKTIPNRWNSTRNFQKEYRQFLKKLEFKYVSIVEEPKTHLLFFEKNIMDQNF